MAEWTSVAVQTVNPGEAIVFTENNQPCMRGYVLHREDSGAFLMKGIDINCGVRRCCCKPATVDYMVDFGANIALPTGETGAISVAFALDGNTLAGTTMTATPAAAEQYFNVSRATNVSIWKGCCQTLSIRNVGTTPILVQAANIVFAKN